MTPRLLLLGAALLLAAGPARADPISIFIALEAVVGSTLAGAVAAAASWISGNVLLLTLVAGNVFGSVAARRKAKRAAARQRAEYNASLQDRSITALQAVPPWRVIYGRCIVGGDVVAIFTSDKASTREDGSAYTKPDGLKHLVVALAGHQVQAINEAYIDGLPLGTLDGSGWVTTGEFYKANQPAMRTVDIAAGSYVDVSPAVVAVLHSFYTAGSGLDAISVDQAVTLSLGNTRITNPSAYTVTVGYTIANNWARVRMSKHLGTDSQTVDTYLNGVLPTQWTTDHRLRGIAYVVVTLDLEEPRFQGGPPALTFDVSGRLLYDPRTATTAWSRNPALVIRDYLTAPWGFGCDTAEIDDDSVIACVNACDTVVALTVGATTTNEAQYTCDGTVTSADSPEAVLEDLAECMAGFAVYGAAWSVHAGAWTTPVMALTDDDLHGQIEVLQAGAPAEQLFNGVRGTFIADGNAQPGDLDPYQNATFVSADGAELWLDVTLPFTNHKARAKNLARVFVERARNGLVVRYPAKLRAWPLQVGDRVQVTSGEYGFSAKLFRVTDWQFDVRSPVVLTLQEDAQDAYDLADAASADPTPNTALPNPYSVAALTSVAAASGTAHLLKSGSDPIVPRVYVSWAAVTDAYVADGSGRIEIIWQRTGQPWRTQNEAGDAVGAYLVGMQHGDRVLIGVRAVNGLQQAGPWAYIAHTVDGAASTLAGKVRTFTQASAPTATAVGDLWYDSDDGNKRYRWSGSAWVALEVDTGGIAANAVSVGDITDSSTTVGSSGSPGASVRAVTLWGPTITTAAGDALDINVSGVLEETFWSQPSIASVELWLTHAPSFGGTQTEFGTRRKFQTPLDVYTATSYISLDMHGQIEPGAVTQDYVLRVSITYRDAAGAAVQCAKDYTSDAQWRVVRRKR